MNRIGKNDVIFISVTRFYGKPFTYVEFRRMYTSEVYTINSIHSSIRVENAVNQLSKPITTIRNNQLDVTFPVVRR